MKCIGVISCSKMWDQQSGVHLQNVHSEYLLPSLPRCLLNVRFSNPKCHLMADLLKPPYLLIFFFFLVCVKLYVFNFTLYLKWILEHFFLFSIFCAIFEEEKLSQERKSKPQSSIVFLSSMAISRITVSVSRFLYFKSARQVPCFQIIRQTHHFSLDTPTFPTNKTVRHDIAETLLKVTLNTIPLTNLNTSNLHNPPCLFI